MQNAKPDASSNLPNQPARLTERSILVMTKQPANPSCAQPDKEKEQHCAQAMENKQPVKG
jgi:hypothetical protein